MEILPHQRVFLVTGVSPGVVLVSLPIENPTAGAAVEFGCAWGNSWSVPSPGKQGVAESIQSPVQSRAKSSSP